MNLLYLLLIPMMLIASTGKYCASCHSGKIDLSHLKSKREWKLLTLDEGEAFKKMHKQNLDVATYIDGDKYNEEELYDYVDFFAYGTKEQIGHLNVKKCKSCHDWRVGMLRTKSEWHALSNSLEPLKRVHIGDKEALKLIESDGFKDRETLLYFIKKISFHASDDRRKIDNEDNNKTKKITSNTHLTKPPEKQMHKIKSKKFDFKYDRKNMSDKAVEKVLSTLKMKFETCRKIDNKISISLYHAGSKEYTSDAIISVLFTLGIAPVRYDNSWVMEVKNSKNVFYSTVNIVSVSGPMSKSKSVDKENEYIEDKVPFMIDEIMAKPEFVCGNRRQ